MLSIDSLAGSIANRTHLETTKFIAIRLAAAQLTATTNLIAAGLDTIKLTTTRLMNT